MQKQPPQPSALSQSSLEPRQVTARPHSPALPETEVSLDNAAAPAPPPALSLDVRFGEEQPLGQGGLGVVSAVRDRLLGRTVAQKRLRGGGKPDPRRADQLWREARITAELEHPGVIPVYDAGLDAVGAPWYTMRHVQGQTLAQAIAAAPTGEDRLRLIGRLLAATETIAYAHARGLIHCDIKPSNILLGPFGETLVIDWGMARAREGQRPMDARQVDAAGTGGTPAYMNPERLAGVPPDASADCWSLGLTLFELLTGQGPPRWDPSAPGWEARLITLAADCGAPRDLLAIALRALSASPSQRYPDAGALAQDLRTWTEGRFVTAHTYSLAEATRLLLRRHRTTLLLSALALLGVSLAAGMAWWQTHAAAQRALLAAQEAEAATAQAKTHLARLALARAEQALQEQRWGEAEVLAAAALQWAESPEARGLLWSTGARRRVTLLHEETIPRRCLHTALREDGGALICLEPEGVSVWDLQPPAQRWRSDEPARQARFLGDQVLLERPSLVWQLLSAEGQLLRPVLGGAAGPTPGTLHSNPDGSSLAWASGYALHRQSQDSPQIQAQTLCTDAPITGLALGPDLKVLLYACGQRGELWNGQGQSRTLGEAEPNFLLRDPAGQRVLMGRRDEALDVLDAAGAHLRTIVGTLRDARWGLWTGDGSLAAIAGDNPGVWLIEPGSGQSLGRMPVGSGDLAGTTASAVVLATNHTDSTRLTWWAPNAESPSTHIPGEVGLADACLAPDGTRVAGARSDGVLRVTGSDGRDLWSARWQPRVLKSCAWSPDGQLLAAVGIDDPAVRLFDGHTGAERARLATPAPVRTLAFAHRGAHLIVSTYGRGYQVFDTTTGETLGAHQAEHEVGALEALEDASALTGLTFSGQVLVYDASSAELRPLRRLDGGRGLALSPGLIAVALPDIAEVVLLDSVSGKTLDRLNTLTPVSGDLALSPDGRYLAAGGVDGWLRVWDLKQGRLHIRARVGEARVPVVRFGGDGRWLLTAGWDGSLGLFPTDSLGWSAQTWQAAVLSRWGLAVDQVLDAIE